MGRIILGVVVGFIAAIVASSIVGLIFIFALGTANIVEPETFAPTMMYVGLLLVLGVLAHFLGSAIARAIGKDRRTAFWYIGVIVVLSVVGIAMSGSAADAPIPKGIPEPSMDMSAFIASFYAQRNLPSWFAYASPIAALIGVALGGFGKGDIKKADAPA